MRQDSHRRPEEVGAVTQRDIAERAGVAQKTVSRALSGTNEVSAATVKRIRAIAEEMGYTPNPLVSSLMRTRRGRGKSETGLSIAWHGASTALRSRDRGRLDLCDTYAEMLEGAREACRLNGFGLEIFPYKEGSSALPRVLRARGIRGLVLGPIGPNKERGLPVDSLKGVYLVRLERDLREAQFDRVVSNAFDEMRMCLEALVQTGCRRIGYIDHPEHQSSSEDRWAGAYAVAKSLEVTFRSPAMSKVPVAKVSKWIDAYIRKEELDGLVVGSRKFIQVMSRRKRESCRIRFVCLERNAWPDWVSGVETNFRQIGAEAAKVLINRILSPHAPDTARQTIAVHSTWHEGTSHLKRSTD